MGNVAHHIFCSMYYRCMCFSFSQITCKLKPCVCLRLRWYCFSADGEFFVFCFLFIFIWQKSVKIETRTNQGNNICWYRLSIGIFFSHEDLATLVIAQIMNQNHVHHIPSDLTNKFKTINRILCNLFKPQSITRKKENSFNVHFYKLILCTEAISLKSVNRMRN